MNLKKNSNFRGKLATSPLVALIDLITAQSEVKVRRTVLEVIMQPAENSLTGNGNQDASSRGADGSFPGNRVGPNGPDIGLPGSTTNPALPTSVMVALGALSRIGQKRTWNTSILNQEPVHRKITAPENRFYVEPRPPSAVELYNHFLKTQKELGALVDRHTSPTYREVHKALEWIAKRAKVDPNNFELDIIRSPEENAFILHHTDIAKPHIFITTGFLEALEARFGRLRQGHLRFIFGHEIGHFVEGHYDQVRLRERAQVQSEDKIQVRHIYGHSTFESAKDYFMSRIFTRDQELRADDHGVRWCAENRKDEPPAAPTEALEVLDFLAEQAEAATLKQLGENKPSRPRFPLMSWAGSKVTNTHPASNGRAARGRGTLRQCEVEQSGQYPLQGPTRRWPQSEPILGLARDPELKKTPRQELLAELNKLTENCKPGELPYQNLEAFVKARVGNYNVVEGFERNLSEIEHLLLIVPALYRVHDNCVPLEPYGHLAKQTPDKRGTKLEDDVHSPAKESLLRIVDLLYDAAESLHSAQLQALEALGKPDRLARAQASFKVWLTTGALYSSVENEDLLYGPDEGVITLLRQNPVAAIEMIHANGDRYFDFRAMSNEWIRPLLESGEERVYERGCWFARLVQSEHIDMRVRILRIFLENGLLDEVMTVDDLVHFAETAESLFGSEPLWERGGIAAQIGNEIGQCLERLASSSQLERADFLANAVSRIQKRTRPSREATDLILLEVMTPFLKGDKNSPSFDTRLAWIEKNFEAGKTRDLVLCRLLEGEVGLFAYCDARYYSAPPLPKDTRQEESSKKKGKHSKEKAKQGDTNSEDETTNLEILPKEIVEKYTECFLKASLLFDCSWFEIHLARGNMAQITLAPDDYHYRAAQEIVDTPLHSPLLHRFASTHYYQLMGPNTPEANVIRFYFYHFVDCYRGHSIELEQLENMAPLTAAEFYRTISERPALLRVIPDLPPQRAFPYSPTSDYRDRIKSEDSEDAAQDAIKPFYEASDQLDALRPSSIRRAPLLDLASENGIQVNTIEEFVALMRTLPEGEFRDGIILRQLSITIEAHCIELTAQHLAEKKGVIDDVLLSTEERRISELLHGKNGVTEERESALAGNNLKKVEGELPSLAAVQELLALLQGAGEAKGSRGLTLATTATERAARLEVIRNVYENFNMYIKFRAGMFLQNFRLPDTEVSVFNLQDVAAEIGRMAFALYYSKDEELKAFQALPPADKLDRITALFVYPSSDKDLHLLRIIKEMEKDADGGRSPYLSTTAHRIYGLLYSPFHKADLGQKIYQAQLTASPELRDNFEAHLALIMDTHPTGSVRRERRLKAFFDGRAGKERGCARTWEQRDKVIATLKAEEATTSEDTKLLRKGGVQFLEEALNELNVSSKERVDTILWMAGLREKSHLVNCYEAVEGPGNSTLKEEVEKLTDDEKKIFIRAVLVGPQGILKSPDSAAKKEFLDTLFFSVFNDAAKERDATNIRYFKAVYDTMLHHIEPERAAEFLGNFLVSHLEGKNFNQQVKIFFESFGFVGVKTAQYLVSSTNMIPADMKEVLMDLTSRVEGPDKRFVYDLAERTYGPDARKIIADIGDRVGGGSLMSFYEVTLHDGRQGVIGVLRPDIVNALPEDILLVHRLIETMHEAPEIFGGKIVSRDLMDNLLWMSLIETNLGRTAQLQEKMRRHIQDLKGDVPVLVPEIWNRHEVVDVDGKKRSVLLNQGSFIFMARAQGKTLDLYLKDLPVGAAGEEKKKIVMNRIAGVFLDQLTKHGLVHCDLHPGNILVHEHAGKIEITFLDIGLSTELDKSITSALHKYLRIGIGNTDFSGKGSSLETVMKKMLGVGEVEAAKARRWIRWTLDIFESELGEFWSEEKKLHAVEVIYGVMSNKQTTVQAKLSQIMDLTRDLGLNFPRQFYYILRAVSVMDYVWQHVDWRAQSARFKDLRTDDPNPEKLPDLDVELICGKLALAAERLAISIDITQAREILTRANAESYLNNRVQILRDGFFELVEATQASNAEELLRTLIQDSELREELGIGKALDQTRSFFEREKGRASRDASEFGFLAAKPLPVGAAKELALGMRFGRLSPIWRMNFYPGTIIRTMRKGQPYDIYLVLGHNELHQPVDSIELGHFENTSHGKQFESLSRAVLGELISAPSSSLTAEWEHSIRGYDAYLRRLEQSSASKNIKIRVSTSDTGDPISYAPHPFDVYSDFVQAVEHTNFQEIVPFKDVLKWPNDQIEVFHKGKWVPLKECMFQEGESAAVYDNHLILERERLGLPTAQYN